MEDGGDGKGARSEEVPMSNFDLSRGVDVFRGKKLLRHFEGANALAEARAYAAQAHGRWVRYFGLK